MSSGSCTCPQALQPISHRKELRKGQRSTRFIQMREEHARAPGIVCVHCGKAHGDQRYDRRGNPKIDDKGNNLLVNMTINHLFEYLYLDEDLYLTWDPATMEPCCTVCNGWFRKGMEVCPVCKVNPVRIGEPMCSACYLDAHPELRQKIQDRKETAESKRRQINKGRAEKRRAMKIKHPCKFHRICGICGFSKIDSRCTFSRTKALKFCKQAVAKKGAIS